MEPAELAYITLRFVRYWQYYLTAAPLYLVCTNNTIAINSMMLLSNIRTPKTSNCKYHYHHQFVCAMLTIIMGQLSV